MMPCHLLTFPNSAIVYPSKLRCNFFPCVLQTERSFKDYLAYLPPLEIATEAVVLLTLLGSVFHTK